MKKDGDCSIIYPAFCMRCIHCEGPIGNGKKIGCLAYPKGIPDKIIDGKAEHLKVREGQVGDYVFTEA